MITVLYDLLYTFCFMFWIVAACKTFYAFNFPIVQNDPVKYKVAMNTGILLFFCLHLGFLYIAHFTGNPIFMGLEMALTMPTLVEAVWKRKTNKGTCFIISFLSLIEMMLLIQEVYCTIN